MNLRLDFKMVKQVLFFSLLNIHRSVNTRFISLKFSRRFIKTETF